MYKIFAVHSIEKHTNIRRKNHIKETPSKKKKKKMLIEKYKNELLTY